MLLIFLIIIIYFYNIFNKQIKINFKFDYQINYYSKTYFKILKIQNIDNFLYFDDVIYKLNLFSK